VFDTPPVFRWRLHGNVTAHQSVGAGDNPPPGAIIRYYLKTKPKKPLTIAVYDEKNKRVVKIEGRDKKEPKDKSDDEDEEEGGDEKKPEIHADKGVNEFAWDLRHQGAERIEKAKVDAGNPKNGPLVAPGTYTIKVIADGKAYSGKLDVRMDPRVTEPLGPPAGKQPPQRITVAPRVAEAAEEARLAKADWIVRKNNLDVIRAEAKEQEQFALRLRDDITRVTEIVRDLRAIRKQISLHQELLGKQSRAKAFVKQERDLAAKLDELEEKLHNPKATVTYDILAQKGGAKLYSQLSALLDFASEGDGPPTQGMKDLAEQLETELGAYADEFLKAKTEDVGKLNELARKLKVPMIWIPARPK
jgi:hypothetical protein